MLENGKKNTGKVREFVSPEKWEPCLMIKVIRGQPCDARGSRY